MRSEKGTVGTTPRTVIRPTERGLVAIDDHWRCLERLRGDARAWRATTTGVNGRTGTEGWASVAAVRGRPAPAG